MTDYTIIGHVAVDRIIGPNEERVQLGGPPTYASVASGLLGGSINAVTKVGGDLKDEELRLLNNLGLDVSQYVVRASATTKFVLDYRESARRLRVESVCENILPRDVDEVSGPVLLAPIIGEIPPQTLRQINAEVLALDPQGFTRALGVDGSVWVDLSDVDLDKYPHTVRLSPFH